MKNKTISPAEKSKTVLTPKFEKLDVKRESTELGKIQYKLHKSRSGHNENESDEPYFEKLLVTPEPLPLLLSQLSFSNVDDDSDFSSDYIRSPAEESASLLKKQASNKLQNGGDILDLITDSIKGIQDDEIQLKLMMPRKQEVNVVMQRLNTGWDVGLYMGKTMYISIAPRRSELMRKMKQQLGKSVQLSLYINEN